MLTRKRLLIFLSLFLLAAAVANFFLLSKFEEGKGGRIESAFVPRAAQHDLVPDDPKTYHFLRKASLDGQTPAAPAVVRAFSGIPLTAEERQNKIKILERQIKLAQRQLRASPQDPEAKENLQTLYTLRDTLVNLTPGR